MQIQDILFFFCNFVILTGRGIYFLIAFLVIYLFIFYGYYFSTIQSPSASLDYLNGVQVISFSLCQHMHSCFSYSGVS